MLIWDIHIKYVYIKQCLLNENINNRLGENITNHIFIKGLLSIIIKLKCRIQTT